MFGWMSIFGLMLFLVTLLSVANLGLGQHCVTITGVVFGILFLLSALTRFLRSRA